MDIEAGLGQHAHEEIDKINFRTIKEALSRIKPNKSDPVWDFSSDFLKEGPDILIFHLEKMLKCSLVHGHVSEILLLATLVPHNYSTVFYMCLLYFTVTHMIF